LEVKDMDKSERDEVLAAAIKRGEEIKALERVARDISDALFEIYFTDEDELTMREMIAMAEQRFPQATEEQIVRGLETAVEDARELAMRYIAVVEDIEPVLAERRRKQMRVV
jgi:hypothetical protein